MNEKSIEEDLKRLQKRMEIYEDAVLEGKGDKTHVAKMLEYYSQETAKVRALCHAIFMNKPQGS